MTTKICEVCGKEFQGQIHYKTCSEECRKERYRKRFGRYADTSISSGTVGAISEIMISADLMKKGYAVFRALSPACFCDVIAIKDKKILRVEIRTGYMAKNGKIFFPRNTHGEIDIFGIYERALNECSYYDKNFGLIIL